MKSLKIVLFSLLVAAASPVLAGTYTVTGLGFLPADATSSTPVSSIATAVSANGNAVGYTTFADGSTEATYWPRSGGIIGLGGWNSKAFGINDKAGFFVGQTNGQAVVWTPGANLLDQNFLSQANGVNDSGEIIGSRFDGTPRAITWLPNNTTLNPFPAEILTGSAINNLGQSVGRNVSFSGNTGYYYSGTGPTFFSLGFLPTSLNDNGFIAGVSTSTGRDVARVFSDAHGGVNIGALGGDLTSFALGINNSNTVVGVSGNGGSLDLNGSATVNGMTGSNAFIYDSTHGIQVVDSLLDPASSPWTIWSANAINNNGQIAGWGEFNLGQQEAVLLTPTPEPSSVVLGGLALLGFFGVSLRQRIVVSHPRKLPS